MSIKSINRIKIATFVILISLPLTFKVLGLNSGEVNDENKKTEEAPTFEFHWVPSASLKMDIKSFYIAVTKFIRRFDQYYSSTFSFRNELLELHNYIKSDILRVDPIPHKVVEGLEGWFFPGDSYSNVIKETKGIEKFSSEELNYLEQIISEHNTWLSNKHIKFYVAVAPDKLSVYQEFLGIKQSDNKTKLQQLEAVASHKFNVIDLKEKFSKYKDKTLFLKTDTHWNDYGAYLGYQSLMEKIKLDFPSLSISPLEDFSIDTVISYQQDLTKMLSLKRKDDKINFSYNHPEKSALVKAKNLPIPRNYFLAPHLYEARYKSTVNNLKVLIFRDSFTSNLVKYMKENFGECVFIWSQNFNRELIESENPDIVIQIIVEREIDQLLKENG